MLYTVFPKQNNNALEEPIFLGNPINVQRYDQAKYPIFNDLTERQKSFFWRPEEIDITKDKRDFASLPEHEKHIFLSNLKYQTLLDSIQGRSPSLAFLPITALPELEAFVTWWTASESIHSASYTHIIRGIVDNPEVVFDDVVENEHIQKRAVSISHYYDDLIEYTMYYNLLGFGVHTVNGKRVDVNKKEMMKKIYLCLFTVNALEAIRFYVSFVCSFSFAERELMEGNAKIIKLIARDESLHLTATQWLINLLKSGKEGETWKSVTEELEEECINIFKTVVEQEKDWSDYLFKDGSTLGLNKDILDNYLEYIANLRITALGMKPLFPNATSNPVPWVNTWLSSDNVQVAPQETEITTYLVGQIDSKVDHSELGDLEL